MPKQNGISFVTWSQGNYQTPASDQSLKDLRGTGADWVSIIVTQYQDTIASTTIQPTGSTPSDASLVHAIQTAHSLGLKVMLKPHVDLSNDPTHSRDEIGSGFSTQQQWDDWFAAYTKFIDHYAQLAASSAVDQFCAGTELSATQAQDAAWRQIVASIRGIYTGPLVYASSFAAVNLGWWDAVDTIGIDAYYPLSTATSPAVADLVAGWKAILPNFSALADKYQKKILFTEVGYRNIISTANNPSDDFRDGATDMQGQANAYEAAFESVYNQPWFAGMFWWSWGTDPLEGGLCDNEFTPQHKTAEDVLRKWFGGAPQNAASLPQPDETHTLSIYSEGLAGEWQNISYDSQGNVPTSIIWQSKVHPHSGSVDVDTTLQQWWALAMGHPAVDVSPYYYLEFYIWENTADQKLNVFLNSANDQKLNQRPVNDCRYTGNKPVQAGVWTQVLIPLADLGAANQAIDRLTIQSPSNFAIEFWLDDVHLVAAK